MSERQTRGFPVGDALATVGLRCNGTMWVSIQAKDGAHYQCDFIGRFDEGPKSASDFLYDPPEWICDRLKRKAQEEGVK